MVCALVKPKNSSDSQGELRYMSCIKGVCELRQTAPQALSTQLADLSGSRTYPYLSKHLSQPTYLRSTHIPPLSLCVAVAKSGLSSSTATTVSPFRMRLSSASETTASSAPTIPRPARGMCARNAAGTTGPPRSSTPRRRMRTALPV